jgi:hypothetical protein
MLALLATPFYHSQTILFFQVESARSSSSSCHAASLVWAKGATAVTSTRPDLLLLGSNVSGFFVLFKNSHNKSLLEDYWYLDQDGLFSKED